jgi:hypothetical protein
MNVEIGTEATQFPKKEYLNGIFIEVCMRKKYDVLSTARRHLACNLEIYCTEKDLLAWNLEILYNV